MFLLLTYIVEKIPHNSDIFVATNRKFEMDFRRWREGIDREIEIGIEDVWTEKGKKGAFDKATEIARWILANHKPIPLGSGVAQELHRIIEVAQRNLIK